jgi:hypothetical protein
MILPAFKFLAEEFSRYVSSKSDPESTEATATLGLVGNAALLFDAQGETTVKDKVVFTLVNLEEDRASRSPLNLAKRAGRTVFELPAIHLNLYVLATATHNKYEEGLGALGLVVTFFQPNKRVTTGTHPSLSEEIGELTVELYTMNFEQVNHLWSTLGGKYMPSVLYKVRQVTLSERIAQGDAGRIEEVVLNPGVITPSAAGQ